VVTGAFALLTLATGAAAQSAPRAQASPSASPAAVQAGVSVRPDTVTVGDPFTIAVRVRVPRDARVLWPSIADSTADIAPRAPMVRRDVEVADSGRGALRDELAEFAVAAWDTGQLATDWPPVLVVVGNDTVPVRLADARVYVRSVLIADTAEHVPRPGKPPFSQVVPWWERWWPALLLLAALAALAWWRRRRRQEPIAAAASSHLGPYEHALHAFERLERLALTEAGEPGRAVTLSLDILRGYLVSKQPRVSLAQTSAELLSVVGEDARMPVPELVHLLVAADAVKYARRPLDAGDARTLLRDARRLVEEIERRDGEQRAREQRAREDAELRARDGADGDAPTNGGGSSRTPAGVA
jgi:hypothetical protein